MSCYVCMNKFGMFRKEQACGACRYSFCSKCVAHKSEVPNKSGLQSVCAQCYAKLNQDSNREVQRPHAFLGEKDVSQIHQYNDSYGHRSNAQLTNHQTAPSNQQAAPSNQQAAIPNTVIQSASTPSNSQPSDQELYERLEKLKRERAAIEYKNRAESGPIASQADIENRLAALRGCDPELIRNPSLYYRNEASSTNHNVECSSAVNDPQSLLQSLGEQINIERKHDGIDPVNLNNTDETGSSQLVASTVSDQSVADSAAEVNALMDTVRVQCDKDAQAALQSIQNDTQIQNTLAQFKQQSEAEYKHQSAISDQLSVQSNELSEDTDSDSDNDNDDVDDKKALALAHKLIGECELSDDHCDKDRDAMA